MDWIWLIGFVIMHLYHIHKHKELYNNCVFLAGELDKLVLRNVELQNQIDTISIQSDSSY